MDLWVVGAAAAAGYIAKYWKNLSRDGNSLSELSSGAANCKKPTTQSRRLSQINKLTLDAPADGSEFSDLHQLESISDITVSTRDSDENVGSMGNYDNSNILSTSSLPTGFSTNENPKHKEGGNGDMGDNYHRTQVNEMNPFYHRTQVNEMNPFCTSVRNRGSLRAKSSYRHFLKPLSSLESCMMTQLFKEHERMEECVLSNLPSSSTTMRPLIVTDGKRVISKASGNYICHKIGSDDIKHLRDKMMCGVPPLPRIRVLDFPKKKHSSTGKYLNDRLSSFPNTGSGTHFLSKNEPHDKMFGFCLGISMGIISSLEANRREMDKLKGLLRQTENLVQDLHEELEMKDSLTVKELASEYIESHYLVEESFYKGTPNPPFPFQDEDNSTKNDGIATHNEKGEESSEAMSKIEAELEAEFERLGLDMNTSGLERRLSDLLELDPDFVPDFTQGELRPEMVHGQSAGQPESDQDASDTLTTPYGNYAVSPKDLTLRLQKVIQSRLEEHVKELETALENSERKLQLMESEHKLAQKLLSSQLRFSSAERSPSTGGDDNFMAHPLVMNLSGEALDAYNEAYEEITKMNESDEEDSPSGFYENNYQSGLTPFLHSTLESQKGGPVGSRLRFTRGREKGWTVVLNAQRLLFSMDEDDL